MWIDFFKLSGAGNDFIGISNLDLRFNDKEKKDITLRICPRRTSVGADGTLFIEPSDRSDFTMRYYNSDGTEAETCGNGARCIARLANILEIVPHKMTFYTRAGQYHARIVDKEAVRVSVSNPSDEKHEIGIDLPEFQGKVNFINTGVPHVVAVVPSLDSYPVEKAGKALRFASPFQPEGANADFIALDQSGLEPFLQIRTYERGVEEETLACGTGCIASALVSNRIFHLPSPVKCQTRSGNILSVYFKKDKGHFKDIELQGPAVLIYQGRYHWKK